MNIAALDALKASLADCATGGRLAALAAMSASPPSPLPGRCVGVPTVASIVGGEARTDAPGGRLTSTNPARR